jgi:hypothetical protein
VGHRPHRIAADGDLSHWSAGNWLIGPSGNADALLLWLAPVLGRLLLAAGLLVLAGVRVRGLDVQGKTALAGVAFGALIWLVMAASAGSQLNPWIP